LNFWGPMICLFVYSRLSNFSTIQRLSPLPVAGLQIQLDLCFALVAWFFYVPHLLRHRTFIFKVISHRHEILTSKC
jgi:hypothetical protein